MKSGSIPGAFGAVLLATTLLACGGGRGGASQGPRPTPAAEKGGDTPADRCLAIAGAKRERKPDEPSKISAKHILVKYAGAKKAPASVTRTREEACLRALEAREKLEHGMPFAEAVSTYSEEPGAATREGSLGSIQRTDVVPPFADAAFELGRGEVSHVVETDFGFHIIQRTE
ncbi:MAG: Peptidyl-prolyl cis-trans isomerase PpiD [Labilithrix sp.]|nr:Peptidyl-prolyl cis-trans isomerase PpiD [Labilithrix sp.]